MTTTYAVLDGGVIVSVRDISDWANYPQHKKDALDEKGDGYATLRPIVNEGSGPALEVVIEPTQVRYVRSTPEPTREQMVESVIGERSRRLALGFDYDFGDERGVHTIGTSDQDMVGWDEVTKGAQTAINLGLGGTTFTIETNTGSVVVTALEWQGVLGAATDYRQPIWAASFALQKMETIPADFADDSYWT